MSKSTYESTVLKFPLDRVWDLLRPLNLFFLRSVGLCRLAPSAEHTPEYAERKEIVQDVLSPDEIGSIRELVFLDGSVERIQLTELSDSRHRLTYKVVSCSSPSLYVGSSFSLHLERVTHHMDSRGKPHAAQSESSWAGQCFAEITGEFPLDLPLEAVTEATSKRKEFFEDIRLMLEKKKEEFFEHEKFLSHQHDAKSLSGSARPNFTGIWRAVRSENVPAFLLSQGFTERGVEIASKAKLIHVIHHKDSVFNISSNGTITNYTVGGPDEDEAEGSEGKQAQADPADLVRQMLSSSMVWRGNALVSSGGDVESMRAMDGDELVLTMKNEFETCKRWFEKVKEQDMDDRMKELSRDLFVTKSD